MTERRKDGKVRGLPRACAAAMLLSVFPSVRPSVAGQAAPQPNLALTILGGVTTGNDVWRIARQHLCVRDAARPPQCTSEFDTLDLAREAGGGLLVGASATYFPSPHLGYQAEVHYRGLTFEDRCRPIYLSTSDPANKNQQICSSIEGSQVGSGAIGVYVGAIVRAASRGWLSPFARAGVGLLSISGSSLALAGVFTSGGQVRSVAIIVDERASTTFLSLQAGAGLTAQVSPGYQLRLELRDALTRFHRAGGPANALGQVPAAGRYYHHLVLVMGLDIVLEQKRGRRY